MSRPASRKRRIQPPPRQPGYDGRMELAAGEAVDPYDREKTVAVMRNIAASPLTAIYARGRLRGPGDDQSDAEARLLAGQRLRGIYERAEMGGSRAIDYSAVKVDVSTVYQGVGIGAGEAMRELAAISRALGAKYAIVRAIVGEEVRFMAYVDQSCGRPSSGTERLTYYAHLRAALDALIWHWGVARGRDHGKIRAERIIECQ